MRIIEWHLEMSKHGCESSGEIEVDDDATDEQIEAEVREEVYSFVSWGWGEKEPEEKS